MWIRWIRIRNRNIAQNYKVHPNAQRSVWYRYLVASPDLNSDLTVLRERSPIVLRIRDVYPGSLIRLFSIPDPGSELSPSRIPDPHQRI
jgi:hypothetical protein